MVEDLQMQKTGSRTVSASGFPVFQLSQPIQSDIH